MQTSPEVQPKVPQARTESLPSITIGAFRIYTKHPTYQSGRVYSECRITEEFEQIGSRCSRQEVKMLYLIGLGLADERDISVKGLDIVKGAARVYLESYTAILLVDKEKLVSAGYNLVEASLF